MPQSLQALGDLPGARFGILRGFLAAADPQQAEARGRVGAFGQVVAVGLRVGVTVVFAGQQVNPVNLIVPDLLAKHAILLAGAGHHADEAAPTGGQAAEVLFGGQFAIRHIDEVGALEQPAQALMVLPVQAIVGLIARIDLMHQRHRPVRRDRQTQNQLFEVGPVILVVAEGQGFRRLPAGIVAAESYRGGVLMDLRAVQPKGFDGAQGQVEEDVLVAAVVKTFQGLADAVVVQAGGFGCIQAQARFIQGRQPVGQGIQRHGGGEDIVDQQGEGALQRQLKPLVLWDVGGDQFGDPELLEIVLDDRMGPEDVLAEQGAGAPTGLRDHGVGEAARRGRAGRALLIFCGTSTFILDS